MKNSAEKPKQLDFLNPKSEEQIGEPTPDEERWRLEQMYETEAGKTSLTKGEAIGKSRRKKEKIGGIITRGRKKIGIHRKGDQEEISI